MSIRDEEAPVKKRPIKRTQSELSLAIKAQHESNKHKKDPRVTTIIFTMHMRMAQIMDREFDEWMRWDLQQYKHLGTRKSHWDWGDWDWDDYDISLHTKANVKGFSGRNIVTHVWLCEEYLKKHGVLEHADDVCSMSDNTNTRALIDFIVHTSSDRSQEVPLDKVNRTAHFVALPAMHVACKQKDQFMLDWFLKFGVKAQAVQHVDSDVLG